MKSIRASENLICYSPKPKHGEEYLNLLEAWEFCFDRISKSDFVVFLAGVSSPDVCKDQSEIARAINVDGTQRFISRFIERKANVLFFSSDVVNGESPQSRDENYLGVPIGEYAVMKSEIEKSFWGNPHFKVFRLSYVFSKDDKFSKYLRECSKRGETADVYNGMSRNVIYLHDVLDAVHALSNKFKQFSNTAFNLSGPELLSRKQLAEYYRELVSGKLEYKISEPPADFYYARPRVIATHSLFLEELLGRPATKIAEAMLREFPIVN